MIRGVAKGPEQGGVGGRSSPDLEICIVFSVTLFKKLKISGTRGGVSYVNFKSRGGGVTPHAPPYSYAPDYD
jgi:hypothetical protein